MPFKVTEVGTSIESPYPTSY